MLTQKYKKYTPCKEIPSKVKLIIEMDTQNTSGMAGTKASGAAKRSYGRLYSRSRLRAVCTQRKSIESLSVVCCTKGMYFINQCLTPQHHWTFTRVSRSIGFFRFCNGRHFSSFWWIGMLLVFRPKYTAECTKSHTKIQKCSGIINPDLRPFGDQQYTSSISWS